MLPDSPGLFVIFFFGAIVALVVFIFLIQQKRARDRTRALADAAAHMGWNFSAAVPMNMIGGFQKFALLNQGFSQAIKNFMYGEASGIKAAVFDFVYVTGTGKSRHSHYQTVVYLEPPDLHLPYFSLRPENFIHKLMGYQDIDFGQRPEFSKWYLLRGQDEPAIRQIFNDRLLAFYEMYNGTCTDAGGNQLLMFRAGERLQPDEIQPHIALALHLLTLMPRY
jgi:hypothetical protein